MWLHSLGGMHEVTRAYIMHEMPHRSSWNQLLIIVPDRVVHPQPQHSATGAEIHRISTENYQGRVGKTQKGFSFSTCDIQYT